ncbi:DEAD/DEAH box helicase [Streptosporangium sp. NPDC002721]|uniref:DEAD/DEAH box helicase n=1 Tax=Streptosporangium sp. NPDC002721 TaxID=3366188 RepID=UPI0036A2F844
MTVSPVSQVSLPGPIAVIPSEKVRSQLAPHLRPGQLIEAMTRLSRMGTLPARLEKDPDRLVVYTDTHVAWLFVTRHGDAYNLGAAFPRGFREEERLLRGALLLKCSAGWQGFHQVRDVPDGMSAHWPLLRRAWSGVGSSEPERPSLPRHHTAYLDRMAQVIEAGRDIEIARQREAPPVHYRSRESVREERRSAQSMYVFGLMRPAMLAAGAMVHLADQPDLKGRVVRVKGLDVLIRFETTVDYGRIPAQGALVVMPSDRVFRAQADTVQALRQGDVVNRGLLEWLVDRSLTPFTVNTHDRPRGTLDQDSQLSAFQRALAVPDLLLILGPPGTGKTRTITEIAVACAARGERVLITSHTNRAVDNVLEQLPADLLAVRVGNEDVITGRARDLMVESHVTALRQRIRVSTEGTVSRLVPFTGDGDAAGRLLAYLTESLAAARTAERDEQGHAAGLDAVIQRLEPTQAGRITDAVNRLTSARATAERLDAQRETWERRHASAQARTVSGMLAFFYRRLADHRLARLNAIRRELALAAEEVTRAETVCRAEQAEMERLIETHPEAARLMAARDTARREGEEATAEASRAAGSLRSIIAAVIPTLEEPLPDGRPPANLAGWEALRDRLEQVVATFRTRAALLDEWRAKIGDAEQDLQRELVRYADVVAATCIGTATTKLLAELEFDLVIVDEAGQISTPNLLVPLVRGKRAILVGDHQQLPPYLDEEVRDWGDNLARNGDLPPADAREIADVLRRSAFERLYGAVPADHQVMLTVQRRMPREVGEFVSAAFYEGVLRTDHAGRHDDPIFASSFAMIDTGDRPAIERAEEAGSRPGYVNRLEADIVVRLVALYTRYYKDWAVIVPYRAQAERIRAGLARVLGESTEVADNVGTVDSFQGGERDLVVYAFTRSNARGEVGFLKELRRLNVAVSRARRQLVLVGDTTTLTAARDEGFRVLVRQMMDHLRRVGDLRPSAEVAARLDRLDEFS